MGGEYRYSASIKSRLSDELINTYLLRPIAGLLVRILYRTPVTPNQVTLASIAAGFASAAAYWQGGAAWVAAGGLLLTLKDLLDSADGQLARAKNQFTRSGRFLDSLGDLAVDLAVFSAIGGLLFHQTGDPVVLLLAALGFAGMTLRVSYHVFYQVSFLHLEGKYQENRIIEEITEEDRKVDAMTLFLHKMFVALYGWQDRLMAAVDRWCRDGLSHEEFRQRWYHDVLALRLSGLLGFGTELFLLMIFSLFDALREYLIFNLVVMNGILLTCVVYRRVVLRAKLSAGASSAGGTS